MGPESNMYELLIRPLPDSPAPADLDELRSRLLRIPTLEERESRRFEFGEADDAGVMTVWLAADEAAAADGIDRIEISVPRPWLPARGPQVFAIVFMAAEWLGWEVYDPQIDDTLKKDVVLQGMVAMRRAQLENEGER